MQLTRRDALVALGAMGAGSYAIGRARERDDDSAHDVATVTAVAEVIYPSQVDVGPEFVETYVYGRRHANPRFDRDLTSVVAALDDTARSTYGRAFAQLSPADRRGALRRLGVDRAHAVRDGTLAQRARYVLVNELLYALYTTPVGGRLLGIENPPGYPGGTQAYQHGPTPEA